MFSSFIRKRIPEISIFHSPVSPSSSKAVTLLRSAVSGPYPPTSASSPPLNFNLQVVESPPTADQLKTILHYLTPSHPPKPASTTFLTAHPSAPSLTERPDNVHDIVELARSNPNAFKWPIVVDWSGGRVCVGDLDCVKGMLERLRRIRDGEDDDEKIDLPKGWFT
ncbi:hypothetical protein APHAL10511_005793 [Amanita phalloides]|nr:hypothetical protein APHAL10511_005793 [Amanita phalloides]